MMKTDNSDCQPRSAEADSSGDPVVESMTDTAIRYARRLMIGVAGGTVVLLGIVMLVTPGPAMVLIPAGLAILAIEFVWARRLLKRVKSEIQYRIGRQDAALGDNGDRREGILDEGSRMGAATAGCPSQEGAGPTTGVRAQVEMKTNALAIYLNDHLGMITGELELARRVRSENEQAPLAGFLDRYAKEVEAQYDVLCQVLAALGVDRSAWKLAAGWLAEKVGRLKRNDSLLEYSPLSRLIELEALVLAAQSRLCLWRTLGQSWEGASPLPGLDFAGLERQVAEQLTEIESHRQAATAEALID